jgi:hypothetical protein
VGENIQQSGQQNHEIRLAPLQGCAPLTLDGMNETAGTLAYSSQRRNNHTPIET